MPFHAGPFLKIPLVYYFIFGLMTMLLLMSSGPAHAEWVLVVADDEEGMTMYVDPGTIRRNGNIVKRWELMDFKAQRTVSGTSFSSVKFYNEYDCAKTLARVLVMTQFSGNRGKGHVVNSHDKGQRDWSPVEQQTIGQTLWELACKEVTR